MTNPYISVIVPNYNYAKYLPARIDSIINQTYTDFELILLDDASTDNSVQVLEEYRTNSHVSYIVVNEKNTGSPFQQWMKGILLARGKYIWIAEADDLAEPVFLETCVNYLNKYPDAVVCYTGSLLIDSEGNISRKDVNHWGKRQAKECNHFNGRQFAIHNIYWRNYIINASSAVFLREKALELKDSSFIQMRYCGDWQFWFDMILKGGIIEIYKNLNYFRQHAAKITNHSRKAGGGILEDIQIIHHMERILGDELTYYKKRLRYGLLYRKIKRLSLDSAKKKQLYRRLSEMLNGGKADYIMHNFNKYFKWLIPTLITPQRDRLY